MGRRSIVIEGSDSLGPQTARLRAIWPSTKSSVAFHGETAQGRTGDLFWQRRAGPLAPHSLTHANLSLMVGAELHLICNTPPQVEQRSEQDATGNVRKSSLSTQSTWLWQRFTALAHLKLSPTVSFLSEGGEKQTTSAEVTFISAAESELASFHAPSTYSSTQFPRYASKKGRGTACLLEASSYCDDPFHQAQLKRT